MCASSCISVRAATRVLGRFGIASPELTKKLEKPNTGLRNGWIYTAVQQNWDKLRETNKIVSSLRTALSKANGRDT
jgi:hypothetical protein